MVKVGDLIFFKQKSVALILGVEPWEEIDKSRITYEILVNNKVQYIDLKKSNASLLKILNNIS